MKSRKDLPLNARKLLREIEESDLIFSPIYRSDLGRPTIPTREL